MADGDLPAIGREDMVVVATHGKSRIDFLRLAGLVGREAEEVSAAVIDEPLAVVRPVGGFDEVGKLPDDGPLPAGDIQDFQDTGYFLGVCRGKTKQYAEKNKEAVVFHVYLIFKIKIHPCFRLPFG